jgi:hypothetical protein
MSMKWSRAVAVIVALVAVFARTRSAHAQSAAASAEALFAEGRRLMSENNFAAACPNFAASQKLDPSSGTLLNLASCYEKLGRTASAWATYQEAASLATSQGRAEHVRVAQKRAQALEPQLARVIVSVEAPVEGLEIQRDNVPVTQAEWGLAVPIDPGAHTYTAKAAHYETWTGQLNVEVPVHQGGTTTPVNVSIKIPALTKMVEAPATPPPAPEGDRAPAPAAPAESHSLTTSQIGAIISGGVGLVGIAIGTGFALAAKSSYDDSLANCPKDKNLCSATGVSQRDDARSQGNIATAGFVVGGLGVAAAAAFLLLPVIQTKTASGPRVDLAASARGAVLRGRW